MTDSRQLKLILLVNGYTGYVQLREVLGDRYSVRNFKGSPLALYVFAHTPSIFADAPHADISRYPLWSRMLFVFSLS